MSTPFTAYLAPQDGAFVAEVAGQNPHLPTEDRLFVVSAVSTGRHPGKGGSALLYGAQLDDLAAKWAAYRATGNDR